jgi:hypothetical protein
VWETAPGEAVSSVCDYCMFDLGVKIGDVVDRMLINVQFIIVHFIVLLFVFILLLLLCFTSFYCQASAHLENKHHYFARYQHKCSSVCQVCEKYEHMQVTLLHTSILRK